MALQDQSVLSEFSDALAAAVEAAGRGTVTVYARRRLPASGIVWTADSVLTCDHVIERDEDLRIGLPDGSEVPAQLAGRDPGSDLAVLKVVADGLTPVTRATAPAKTGHLALALGRPGPGGVAAALGVVSTVGGAWRTMRGGQVDGYLRADVTLYPGFSGGPLVNVQGEVVGINSSRLGRGAGMTIPVAAAAPIAEALLRQGRLKRGYLGIGSQPVRLPQAMSALLNGQETGLLLVNVEAGAPAERGGLLMGDILVAFGGTPLRDTDDLQAKLGSDSANQAAVLTVLRGGERREITVTIGERQ